MGFKRIIDDYRTAIIRFLMIYGVCFGVFLVIDIVVFLQSGTIAVPIPLLIIAPVVMAIIAMFALNKFSNAFGRVFYGGRYKPLSVAELAKCELDKIRFSKMKGRFEEALQIINELLKNSPDHPEALFLKAQIYHEAYGYHDSARKCLQKIIDTVPIDKEAHQWAANYLGQILLSENAKKSQAKREVFH